MPSTETCTTSMVTHLIYIKIQAHPYVLGWPDVAENAEYVCRKHNTRLCSLKEVDTYAKKKRSHCVKSWVYDTDNNKIVGCIANSEAKPCFDSDASKYALPAYGALPGKFEVGDKIFFFYLCLHSTFFRTSTTAYECNGNGEDYMGYVAVTMSGKNCQVWEVQEPNVHEETPQNEIYGNLQRNYCRNPTGLERPVIFIYFQIFLFYSLLTYIYKVKDTLLFSTKWFWFTFLIFYKKWCYLADSVGWEYCDIQCQMRFLYSFH